MLRIKGKLVGKIKQKSTLKGKLNNLIKYEYPPLEDLEVSPSGEEQVFTHEGSYGYDRVVVKASDSAELEASFLGTIDNTLLGKNCTKLPSGLTKIRQYAFYECSNLNITELPEGVTHIKTYAFNKCTNLALTKLPSTLIEIGTYAFNYCHNLNIKVIPAGVKSIENYSFANCKSLTELTILGQTIEIRNLSFNACDNLAKLVFPNITKVVTISSSSFNSTPIKNGTGLIYVPDNLVDTFKTATNWSAFADQIKPLSEL